jgi:hypothetical protein
MRNLPVMPPARDEAERWGRIEGMDFEKTHYWHVVFVGGWLVLALFGVLAMMGLPGSGLVLVQIGIGMIIGSGIQLLVDR